MYIILTHNTLICCILSCMISSDVCYMITHNVFKYMLFIGVMSDVGSIRSWQDHSHQQAVMLLNIVVHEYLNYVI